MRVDSGVVGEDREVKEMSAAQALVVLFDRLYTPGGPTIEIRISEVNGIVKIETLYFREGGVDFLGGNSLSLVDGVTFEDTIEESLPLLKLAYVALCNHQLHGKSNSSYTTILFLEGLLMDYKEDLQHPRVKQIHVCCDLTSNHQGLLILAAHMLGYNSIVSTLRSFSLSELAAAHDIAQYHRIGIKDALDLVRSGK